MHLGRVRFQRTTSTIGNVSIRSGQAKKIDVPAEGQCHAPHLLEPNATVSCNTPFSRNFCELLFITLFFLFSVDSGKGRSTSAKPCILGCHGKKVWRPCLKIRHLYHCPGDGILNTSMKSVFFTHLFFCCCYCAQCNAHLQSLQSEVVFSHYFS